MVVPAQNVRSAIEGMMPDPPTPFGVAIDFAHSGINPDSNCTYQGCLTDVGADSGPEVVVHVGSTMKRAAMDREPMSDDIEERNDDGNSHHQQEEENPKRESPRVSIGPSGGGGSRRLSLGQRTWW